MLRIVGMSPLVVLASLAAAAHADRAPGTSPATSPTASPDADPDRWPTPDDAGPGPDHDIDDNPLAQDLRGAFGANVSRCDANSCTSQVRALWCETARDACHAIDRRSGRTLESTGKAAHRLALHLRGLGSASFDRDRVAAWDIACSASRFDAGQGSAFPMHGHCVVQLKDGDAALAEALSTVGASKLGGNWWTGREHVTCTGPRCHVACEAPRPDDDVWERCGEGGEPLLDLSGGAAVEVLRRRGGSSMTVQCRRWRSELWDGGLVDVVGCGVD
jgi:hypothetical protein